MCLCLWCSQRIDFRIYALLMNISRRDLIACFDEMDLIQQWKL